MRGGPVEPSEGTVVRGGAVDDTLTDSGVLFSHLKPVKPG